MEPMRFRIVAAALVIAPCLSATAARAAPGVHYGIQDDAWLQAGTTKLPLLDDRLRVLDRLGVDAVRYTFRWYELAPRRPKHPADPADPAYDWSSSDAVLDGLHAHRIAVLLTVWGTPAWANGGRRPPWAPKSSAALASFVTAAAKRYPWVHMWEIWNEPNQRGGLRPNSPRVYVHRLLNPAFDALHARDPANRVAGGATSPRATRTALSAITFMRGMRAAGARFDAYSHHPYPRPVGRRQIEAPAETLPCSRWLTMGNLQCLLAEVGRDFGPKRVWLTEYGYKTNPPDWARGVSPALQARYIAEAARRVYQAPRVDLLINFLVRDEPVVGRWASGFFTAKDAVKPSFYAFMLPLAETARRGYSTTLWGQVRPRSGAQPYELQELLFGRWQSVTDVQLSGREGYFTQVVAAGPGARFRVWSPFDSAYSPTLVVR